MELSYFEEAIDFLMKQQMIKTDKGIGICGISKGADIALTLSAILSPSKLGAIAVLNTLISSAVVGATYQGRTVTKGIYITTILFRVMLLYFRLVFYFNSSITVEDV